MTFMTQRRPRHIVIVHRTGLCLHVMGLGCCLLLSVLPDDFAASPPAPPTHLQPSGSCQHIMQLHRLGLGIGSLAFVADASFQHSSKRMTKISSSQPDGFTTGSSSAPLAIAENLSANELQAFRAIPNRTATEVEPGSLLFLLFLLHIIILFTERGILRDLFTQTAVWHVVVK